MKAQVDMMIDGLNTLGIYNLIRANPCAVPAIFDPRIKEAEVDSLLAWCVPT